MNQLNHPPRIPTGASRAGGRMGTFALGSIALLLVTMAIAVSFLLQPALAYRQPGAPGTRALSPQLETKLSRLSADNPEGYLLLAEDVADGGAQDSDLRLARQLYTLALVLDSARKPGSGTSSSVAASACYGLAELTRSQTERRWLLATASAARPGLTKDRVRASPLVEATPNLAAAVNLFDAIALARAGEGRRADTLLKRPGTTELLNQYERALDDRGYFNSAARIKRWINDWPTCSECGNRRVVNRTEGGKATLRLCGTCRGNPGPQMELDDLINQVRFQSALLSGIQNSWSAALLIDGGEPAREPEPAEVARVYGVDPTATQWQGGQWTKPK